MARIIGAKPYRKSCNRVKPNPGSLKSSLEAIRKLNLSKSMIYWTIGIRPTGEGVRKHVEGTAGTGAVSLGFDGRIVDDSGTDDSSGPNPTRGTPTRS
jgi:hypothetical protein